MQCQQTQLAAQLPLPLLLAQRRSCKCGLPVFHCWALPAAPWPGAVQLAVSNKERQATLMGLFLGLLAAGRPGFIEVSADIYNGAPAPAGVFDFMVSMLHAELRQAACRRCCQPWLAARRLHALANACLLHMTACRWEVRATCLLYMYRGACHS